MEKSKGANDTERDQDSHPRLVRRSLEYCIQNGLNPNPNPEGELWQPEAGEAAEAGREAGKRILKIFSKANAKADTST